MFESPIKLRDLIIFSSLSSLIVLVIFLTSLFDTGTKVVFCDVGQGDGAYIRIDNKIDVLIDAGPDKSILSCLGKYMPFWDKKIELAFLSHPNNDHYNGYFYLIDRYQIDKFITVDCPIKTNSYNKLLKNILDKQIPIIYKTSGDKIIIGKSRFDIYWPPSKFSSANDNDFSQILSFQENGLRLLFTGDASPFSLSRLSHQSIDIVDILKVPHHGSKNGLIDIFLDLADPTIAVISVGKNNSYGHPHKQVLDMLKAKNIIIKRTDEDGDVVFNLKE